MLKRISLLAVTSFAAAQDAVPDDAALLAWAKDRSNGAERVTHEAHRAGEEVMRMCREPSPQDQRRLEPPHGGRFIHVFANDPAAAPLWDRLEKFPVGSLILKEKLPAPDSTAPELFTGMLKREPGFWPENGDWEYFTLDGPLTKVTSRGKTESCAKCHRDVPEQDFVFRHYTLGWGRISPTSRGRFLLAAGRAQVHGAGLDSKPAKLRYEPEPHKNTLGYWTNAQDWASWQINITRPGSYRVHILQGCGNGSGGAELDIRVGDAPPVRFTVQETGGFQNFIWREVGTLDLRQSGPARLEVRPRTKPGPAVMDLRQLRLEPIQSQ